MENQIADELTLYYSNNGEDEEMMDLVQDESEKLARRYQNPEGVLPSKRNMADYRETLIKNIERRIGFSDRPEESKQPFREHYNRLFKGRDVL